MALEGQSVASATLWLSVS